MKYHDLADFIGWLRYRLNMMKHCYAITKYNIVKYNARNKKRLPQLGPLKNSFVQKFLSQCLHQSSRNLCGQICLSKVYTICSIRFSTCFLRPSFSSEACANDDSARNCCTIYKIVVRGSSSYRLLSILQMSNILDNKQTASRQDNESSNCI